MRAMPAVDPIESQRLWREARTFAELCELGARFVEGEIAFFPGWMAPELDDESIAIAPRLARLCRAGFLTLASQPGRAEHAAHDGSMCVQRAFVGAFARPELAVSLADAADASTVAIFVHARRGNGTSGSPVAMRGGVPYLYAGHDAFDEEIECFEDHLCPQALAALAATTYVSAYDPTWGRDGLLWDELERIALAR
jgi:Domain of unknown function (DUF6919)